MNSCEKMIIKNNKVFLLREGKIITKSLSLDGKVISNHLVLKSGDLVFDCLNYFNKNNSLEIEVEIEALENSILEEVKSPHEIEIYEKMLFQLMKKNVIELQYQLYNSKGYILTILKLLGNEVGEIKKKNIKLEYFNVGKTQFYKIYKELKEEHFIKEIEETLHIDKKKIDEYLEELLLD